MFVVLVVNDQYFVRARLRNELAKFKDVATVEADNGLEAIKKAKSAKPDLILLDIVMPDKNGLEVLKELQEDKETKDIPVIIASSNAQKDLINKAKELGAVNFLDIGNIEIEEISSLLKNFSKN